MSTSHVPVPQSTNGAHFERLSADVVRLHRSFSVPPRRRPTPGDRLILAVLGLLLALALALAVFALSAAVQFLRHLADLWR